jgi:hypothetical protein
MDCFSLGWPPVGGRNEAGEGGSRWDSPTHARYMVCNACKLDHSPLVRCEVHKRIAINESAINGAINTANGETPLDQPVIPVAEKSAGVDSPERRTPNRRDRKAYNEYMREYMRTHRPRKKNPT